MWDLGNIHSFIHQIRVTPSVKIRGLIGKFAKATLSEVIYDETLNGFRQVMHQNRTESSRFREIFKQVGSSQFQQRFGLLA
jgi:hypothetical protein